MPPRENRQLVEILDVEFARIRSQLPVEQADQYRTVKDMADFLGIDATLLSRYRIGDRSVSRRWAIKFAAALRADDVNGQKALIDKLLSAKPPQNDEEMAVAKWFEDRGHEGFLMLVQFFEPPVLRTQSDLLKSVAQAVAKGLCYGIMVPFSPSETKDEHLPEPLQIYLMKIWSGVKVLYSLLLVKILEEAATIWNATPHTSDRGELKQVLMNAANRIKVYRIKESQPTSKLPAIEYRLFYCSDHQSSGSATPELWQWISTPLGEMMLQRKPESFELEAVEALLYPVPQWFESQERNDYNHKPTSLPTQADLLNYYDLDHSTITANMAPVDLRWEVAEIDGVDVKKSIADVYAKHDQGGKS